MTAENEKIDARPDRKLRELIRQIVREEIEAYMKRQQLAVQAREARYLSGIGPTEVK